MIEWKQFHVNSMQVLDCLIESICNIDDPVINGFADLLEELDSQFLEIAGKTPALQRISLLRVPPDILVTIRA
jgi:hypothetical protein